MKTLRQFLYVLTGLALLAGCANPNTIIDDNKALPHHNWAYTNALKYDVKIDDASIPYNIFLNLRVTGDYKYSNMFVLLKRGAHGGKLQTTRFEFKLANPDGQWLGAGSGNLYSYRFLLLSKYKFPSKGLYHFEIEQNMRDNPLREVSDAGICIEKANQ